MKTIDPKTVLNIAGRQELVASMPQFTPVHENAKRFYDALLAQGYIDKSGKPITCISCRGGMKIRHIIIQLYDMFLKIYENSYYNENTRHTLLPLKKVLNEDSIEMVSKDGTRMII